VLLVATWLWRRGQTVEGRNEGRIESREINMRRGGSEDGKVLTANSAKFARADNLNEERSMAREVRGRLGKEEKVLATTYIYAP
jgi:hypothetical protein